jgi:hypothetical protein
MIEAGLEYGPHAVPATIGKKQPQVTLGDDHTGFLAKLAHRCGGMVLTRLDPAPLASAAQACRNAALLRPDYPARR